MDSDKSSSTIARDVPRGDDDWPLCLRVVRALMVCEETMRLYPVGHPRGREAIKNALADIFEYHAATRRVFTFVPDLALELSSRQGRAAAKDVVSLANQCREHLIRRLAIRPEVDCVALAALLGYLQSAPTEATPHLSNIEIEHFLDGEDGPDYRFSDAGEQVFASTSSGARASPTAGDLPVALRKNLAKVFSGGDIQDTLDRLRSRLGLDDAQGDRSAGTDRADGKIDLVDEIVKSLFAHQAGLIDTPRDVLSAKIRDFLRFLEGLAPALPPSGSARSMGRGEVSDLIASAVGMRSAEQVGMAELFHESSRLKKLLSGVDSFRAAPAAPPKDGCRRRGGPRSAAPPDGSARAGGLGAAERRVETREDEPQSSGTDAEEPAAAGDTPLRQRSEQPALDGDLVVDLEALDFELEALRIRVELLAEERDAERYSQKRGRFLECFGSRQWSDAACFADELDETVRILAGREDDGGAQLAGEALLSRDSQECIDRFFERRTAAGASLVSLRPLTERLAADDVARSVGAMTHLWNLAGKESGDEYLDEIFTLTRDPERLARWGSRQARAFCSRRAESHLRQLPFRVLEKLLRCMLAYAGDAGPGGFPAVAAVLRIAAERPDSESVLLVALRQGSRQLQIEALTALDTWSSSEMLHQLTRIVDNENQSPTPHAEAVRLALSALARSPMPQARHRLRRIRSARRRFRLVYRREIRQLVDAACQTAGVKL